MSTSTLLNDSAVTDVVHAAFAQATGIPGTTVPNLDVQADATVDGAELDLFGASGFELKVNPVWALGLDPQNLTDHLRGMVMIALQVP